MTLSPNTQSQSATGTRWRKKESLRRTRDRRPDLFQEWLQCHSPLTKADAKLLQELSEEYIK